jgi:cobalt-zinc-cadmium efflux system membrane fusion protein
MFISQQKIIYTMDHGLKTVDNKNRLEIMKISISLALLTAGLFFSACGKKDVSADTAAAASAVAAALPTPAPAGLVTLTARQSQNIGVVLGRPERRHLGASLQLSGEVDVPPAGLVSISVPYGGFLKHTRLMPGARIRKGQVLAVLEHPDYIQLQQDYLDTQTRIQLAELEYARQRELNQEKISALKTLQQVRAELQLLRNNRAALRQKLMMININPDRLSPGSISRTISLLSPINGYVKNVNANIGTLVSASDVLLELVNTEHLHIRLNAFEKDIPHLYPGQPFSFRLANDNTERTARIGVVGRVVAGDKTIPVHADLARADAKLLPGMFVTASIKTKAAAVTALPETAVVQYEGQSYIFVEQAPNLYRRVPVTTGTRQEAMVAVQLPAELENSAKIAVQGAHNLLARQANAEAEEE